MFIEEVHLESFKRFKDFTVRCHPFTVLVGANSSGKTSILQAISFIHDFLAFVIPNANMGLGYESWAPAHHALKGPSMGDPWALWFDKNLDKPLIIQVKFTGGYSCKVAYWANDRYSADIFHEGISIKETTRRSDHAEALGEFLALDPTYLPPIGAASPDEKRMKYPQVETRLNAGGITQVWRNNLYWLLERGNKAEFEKIAHFVSEYLPGSRISQPRISPDDNEFVIIEYIQDEATLDIGMSGSGHRALLNMAAMLFASHSKCLLFDEPDAHLHGTLQRTIAQVLLDFSVETNTQMFIATHSPEFMAAVPTEHLIWIDRNEREGRSASELGRILVDLGAITSADAINAARANKVLFCEGNADRTVLQRFFALSGSHNPLVDKSVVVAKLPRGKGDKNHLRAFPTLLRHAFGISAKVACIFDNDYDLGSIQEIAPADAEQPLLLTLERKEIENYLIDAEVFSEAARIISKNRGERTGEVTVPSPSASEVRTVLLDIMEFPEIKETLKYQITPRYRDLLDKKYDASTKERLAEEWFAERWNDEDWRLRNCPGKEVLQRLRTWCQEKYNLSVSTPKLAATLTECPPDFRDLAAKLQEFFWPSSTPKGSSTPNKPKYITASLPPTS